MNAVSRFFDRAVLWLLCAFLIAVPYEKHFVRAVFFSAALSWVASLIGRYGRTFYRQLIEDNLLNALLLLFFVVALVAAAFGLNPYESRKVIIERYLLYLVFFWISFSLTNRSAGRTYALIFFLLVSGCLLGAGGVWDFFMLHPKRLFTVFGRGINMSAFLPFFLPLCLSLLTYSKDKLLRGLSYANLVFLVPVVTWHASRLVWVTLGMLFLVFLVFFRMRRQVILLVAGVLLLSVFVLPRYNIPRAKTLLAPLSRQALGDRIDLAESSVELVKENPVFGAGPGMFGNLYKPPAGHENEIAYRHLHVHNLYLELASESGMLGLLSFLAVFAGFAGIFLRRMRNISGEKRAAFFGLSLAVFAELFACFGGSFILVGFQDALLFWLVFGAAAGLAYGHRQWREEEFCPQKAVSEYV